MRIARCLPATFVLHIISRFHERRWFLDSDAARSDYLRLLGRAMGRTDWSCLAYCLMSNHIHLAMVAGESALGTWSRAVHAPFATAVNRRERRIGAVFADRPAAHVIKGDDVARLIAYIHNNPVRAGVCARASQSTWSSHRAYTGESTCPDWLQVDAGLRRGGFDGPPGFDEFVGAESSTSGAFTADVVAARGEARRRYGAIEAGTPIVGSPVEVPLVARPFATIRPDPVELVETVAKLSGVAIEGLTGRWRRGPGSRLRTIAAHTARATSVPLSDLGSVLGVSRQRCSRLSLAPLDPAEQEIVVAACAELRWAKVDKVDSVPSSEAQS
jgi:REP element-mobilizing transposase RayT